MIQEGSYPALADQHNSLLLRHPAKPLPDNSGEYRRGEVCVCMLACGPQNYLQAARIAVRSVVAASDFDIFVAVDDPNRWRGPRGDRVQVTAIEEPGFGGHRAAPFLRKFIALEACLAEVEARLILLLDADAILVQRTTADDVRRALGGRPIGMVEQPGIRQSPIDRAGFYEHYLRHSHKWIDPGPPPPPPECFRYFNSGVILGERDELAALARWATDRVRRASTAPEVGEHMISDQDLFQYWVHTRHQSSCAELDWNWNHSPLWHDGFPRRGARIIHLSNFCRGPGLRQLVAMRWLGTRPGRAAMRIVNRLIGRRAR